MSETAPSEKKLEPSQFDLQEFVRRVLAEDMGSGGDITSAATIAADAPGEATPIPGGIRLTFGPVQFDFGAMYYWYPNETQQFLDPTGLFIVNRLVPFGSILTLNDSDMWEVYGKMTWTVTDWLAIGPYVYYTPSWLNTGAKGTYAG